VEPAYETLAGWRLPERVTGVTDLPPSARQFIDRLTALLDVPVTMIGLGRGRDALIRTGPFAQAARE
jgi:adenylosuccinate synthase